MRHSVTRNHRSRLLGLALSALFVGFAPQAQGALFTSYNVVTTGDLTINSHIDYNTFVCGNLYVAGSSVLASHSFSNPGGLSVAGEIKRTQSGGTQLQINNGKKLVMTDLTKVASNVTVLMNGGGSKVQDASLPSAASQLAQELTIASSAYKALAAGTLNTVAKTSNGQLTFTVGEIDAQGRAVFNINGSIFNNSNYQNGISLAGNYAGASSIIVNVSGASITHGSTGTFNGVWNDQANRAKTLWNFWEAASINLNKNFNGAILAPLATLTKGSTSTDGSIWVKNLTSSGETHSPYYSGFVPSTVAVPEPSTLAIAGVSLALLGGYASLRREKHRQR